MHNHAEIIANINTFELNKLFEMFTIFGSTLLNRSAKIIFFIIQDLCLLIIVLNVVTIMDINYNQLVLII